MWVLLLVVSRGLYPARDGAPLLGPLLHPRDRGGAHDRGRGDPRPRQFHRTAARRPKGCTHRGRGQARADGVGLRDRHDAREQHRRGGRSAARDAADRERGGTAARPQDRIRRHAPVRALGGPADRRATALPRPDLRAPVRGAPGDHLRHPRARGRGPPGQGDPRDQRDARAPAAAAGAVGQLAVLARRQHRARLHSHADLPCLPARGHPAALRRLRGLGAPDRVHDGVEGDRRLHVPLVRRAPASELRHGRGAGDGLPDARGAHARARRAGPGDGEGARRALRRGEAALALPVRDARREQVDGRPPWARRAAGGPARQGPRARTGAHAGA